MDARTLTQHGANIAVAFFNNPGNFAAVMAIGDDATAGDALRRSAGRTVLHAILITLARALAQIDEAGHVRFTGQRLAREEDVIYAIESGRSLAGIFTQLLTTVAAVRRAAPGITASLPQPEAPAPVPPAPIPVAVVAMPARRTVSDITRNAAGEIESAMQVESDF